MHLREPAATLERCGVAHRDDLALASRSRDRHSQHDAERPYGWPLDALVARGRLSEEGVEANEPQLPRNVSLRLRTTFSGKFLANGGPEPLGRETGRVDHPPWPAGSAWSPPPESNRRPHPYHGSAAERPASRRLRSSQRTVDAAVMGSVPAPASRPPRPSSVVLPAPRRRRVLPWGNLLRVLPRPLAAPRARRGSVPASAPPGSAPRWATRRRTGHRARLPLTRRRHRG